jgi:hypothetical protein
MLGSDVYKLIRLIRVVFPEPITSTLMQCSCKHLTIVCSHYQSASEAKIFHALPMVSDRSNTINFNVRFLLETSFKKELLKTKETTINAES